ncbi:MAG: hypothetical protein HYY93_04130 [Planctomycetes bacterium]|nr:hypothetical protein [Planctomycetota bacterium]
MPGAQEIIREAQSLPADVRVRRWIWVAEAGKFLRVVTLPDGETVHNALFDKTTARGEL